MSSLRNAVSRRPHKERAQPSQRAKWGLLEKHKDYSLRARDFHQKKAKLNILQQKTRERHPDEFSFGMLSQAGGQGKHGQRKSSENALSHEAVSLLKTQDAGYLRNAAQRTRKELDRVQEEVGVGGAFGKNQRMNKVVFDDEGEGEPVRKKARVSRDAVEDEVDEAEEEEVLNVVTIATPPSTLPKPAPKLLSRKQAEKEKDRLAQLKADRKRRKRLQELRAAKLEALKKRQKDILAAADQLELQRAKMGNVIGGTNKNGVKFKIRERKR